MFWTILILGVASYILYNFFREREHMLQKQVDMQGGMAKKYEYLIKRITDDANAKIVKVTRDHIQISAIGQTSATTFLITESFNTVEIEWVGQQAMLGTHKHKWSFPHNYPQETIIREIEEFMEWKMQQMFGSKF